MPVSSFTYRLAAFGFFFSCRNVDGLLAGASMRPNATAPKLDDELLDRFIVVPEHNLLFCYMEKVACTNFNELFRRLRSRYDPSQAEGDDCWYKNTPEVHGLTKHDLEDMLASKEWHKAVFYRNPLERFVSAYASKCGHADVDGARHCRQQFGQKEFAFGEAVESMADRRDSTCNEHFRRMGSFCGGLGHTLQYYDTVEELDVDTANAKVSKLLNDVGVKPQSIEGFDDLFPPVGGKEALKEREDDASHITNTEDSMKEYFPPGYLGQHRRDVLMEYYRSDYELFGISAQGKVFLEDSAHKLHWPLLSFAV